MEFVVSQPVSVLFVCLGNICRSPTGEGVFQHYVEQQGVADRVRIDSAGTIGYHAGNPADARMRQHASRRGFDLKSISRKVTVQDLEDFDLVIAMDQSNHQDLQSLGITRGRLAMLGEFLPDGWHDEQTPDVPDPYYGGEAGFEEVLDMIEAACPQILEALEALIDGD